MSSKKKKSNLFVDIIVDKSKLENHVYRFNEKRVLMKDIKTLSLYHSIILNHIRLSCEIEKLDYIQVFRKGFEQSGKDFGKFRGTIGYIISNRKKYMERFL